MERLLRLACVQVPDCSLHGGFRHVMTANGLEERRDFIGFGNPASEDPWNDEVLENVPGGARRFVVIVRLFGRGGLAMTNNAFAENPYQSNPS